MSGLSKTEKRHRKQWKKALKPVIKPFRSIRRFVKGTTILKGIVKGLITIANLAITGYEIYNNHIKEFIEKRNAMTS